jgi:hypothetical protein
MSTPVLPSTPSAPPKSSSSKSPRTTKKKSPLGDNVHGARKTQAEKRKNRSVAEKQFHDENWALVPPNHYQVVDSYFRTNFKKSDVQYSSFGCRDVDSLDCFFAVFPPTLIVDIVNRYRSAKPEGRVSVTIRAYILSIIIRIMVDLSIFLCC